MITLASSRATSQRITSPSGARGAARGDQVADRRGRLEQVEDLLGLVGWARRSAGGPWRAAYPRAASLRLACVLTDYHLHLRPDDDDTPRRALLHRRERRPLPRRRRAGRDRGAGRLRARLPLHPGARRSGVTRSGSSRRRDDLDAYCEFVRARRCGSGSSATSSPAPRTASPRCWSARLRLRRRLGPLRRRRARSTTRAGTSGRRAATPTRSGAATSSRSAESARSGLFDILAHPDLVKVWGRARPLPERDPRFFYEPAVEAIAESGIAVEVSTAGPAQAGRRDLPGPRLRRDVRRGRRRLRPLLRRPPSRAGRLRLRPGGRVPRASWASRRSACSSAASGGSSRSVPARRWQG